MGFLTGTGRSPFKITPDTRLFWDGAGRGDVIDALVYAITSGEGSIACTASAAVATQDAAAKSSPPAVSGSSS